ncbi:DUF262 domain-containing protein [Yoonia maritima]|uniref:DUF262 domain-containing protein n=1 Tax=Yoonia maritima TaxID=1435347 RepID=UPI000D0FE4FD|nr:DUF262 domain-containing protein [Yoonia maritima]
MTYSTTTISDCLGKVNEDWFLPSIQRPYVWDTTQIIRLFDSLLKGLPISTFLLWNMSRQTASSWDSYRFIENFKQGDTHNIRVDLSNREATYILDGQQRLTSLLIGFYGSYTVKAKFARKGNLNAWTQKNLYLDLMKSPDEAADDDLDSDIVVTYGLDFFERDQRITPEKFWFRVSRLKGVITREAFERLHHEVMGAMPAGTTIQDRRNIEANLERLWDVYCNQPIISYFTEENQSLDRVLNIFIRANDAGTKLSKSDLLMTMATAKWQGLNAKDEVFGFVDHINSGLRHKNKINKDFVLKSCLVLENLEVAYKVDNFTNANLELIEDAWPSIKRTLLRVFEFVNSFGIDKDTLTSTNALMPIAYYMHRLDADFRGSTGEECDARQQMMRWLLGALINGAFSGTSDRAIAGCRAVIKEHLRTSKSFPRLALIGELGRQNRISTFTSDNVERLLEIEYGDKRSFLALSLLYDTGSYDASSTQIDHIIPQASIDTKLLQRRGIPYDRITAIQDASQRLGNLQLLLSRENNEKRDTPFSHWIETRDENFLSRHSLPADRSLWNVESLPEFVFAREKLIAAKIKNSSPAPK